MNKVKILGPDGNPLSPTRPSMLSSGSRIPYDAADSFSDQLANWQPALWSPDNEINIYRDRIVSRARDLVRNDGWASGAITRLLDNAVGANFRPIMKPDYRVLRMMTGNKAFDATWAEEYGKALDGHWRTWSNDTGRYCDAERKMTVSQMLRLGFRHKLIDGDALAVLQYRTDRLGRGRGRYAIIASNHQAYRHSGLNSGEVAVYNQWGLNIVLTENGILVNANGKDVEVNNATNITINASESILANTPLFQCTGDIVDNCNTNSSTLKALREAYNDHDHDVDKVQGGEDKVISEKTKGQVDG